MSNLQLFFAIAAFLTAQTTILVLYFNAKIDPVREDVKMLVQYMVNRWTNEQRVLDRNS